MIHLRFQAWCRTAVSQIIYIQDRIDSERELMRHMEDRYEAMIEQGCTHDEAEISTVEAMGNPYEIAVELGRIHRPFWGLMQQRSRKVLLVALAVTVIVFWLSFTKNVALGGYDTPKYANFNPFTTSRHVDDAGHFDRLYHLTPNTTATAHGFTITATHAALWQYTPSNTVTGAKSTSTFYIQLNFFNPLPWAHHDGEVTNWFRAEDSLGNVYSAYNQRATQAEPAVYSSFCQTGPLTYVHDLYLSEFISQDAQWLDLHYDRAGEHIVLRIPLTGGAS